MSSTVREDYGRDTCKFTRRLSFVDCSIVARRCGQWGHWDWEIGLHFLGRSWRRFRDSVSAICFKGKQIDPGILVTLRLVARKTLISISRQNLEVWLATFLQLVVKETWPLQFNPQFAECLSPISDSKSDFGCGFDFVQNMVFRFLDAWAPIFPPMSPYWWTECQATHKGCSLWLHSLQVLIGLRTSGMVCSRIIPHVEHWLIDPWPTGWWSMQTGRRETERFPGDLV